MIKSILVILLLVGISSADNIQYIRDDIKNVVFDTTTNLTWHDDTNATALRKTWSAAISYCSSLGVGGYNDWRLPNYNELHMLVDRAKRNPALSPVFQNVVATAYWSSTTYVSTTSSAWYVIFLEGNDHWGSKNATYNVRCVR